MPCHILRTSWLFTSPVQNIVVRVLFNGTDTEMKCIYWTSGVLDLSVLR